MRTFAITTLVGVVLLNCFLGYSGQYLADQMHPFFSKFGSKMPGLTESALVLPPWFYAVALLASVVLGFSFWCRLSNDKLVYLIVGFLTVDLAGLLWLLWGFCIVPIHFGKTF